MRNTEHSNKERKKGRERNFEEAFAGMNAFQDSFFRLNNVDPKKTEFLSLPLSLSQSSVFDLKICFA